MTLKCMIRRFLGRNIAAHLTLPAQARVPSLSPAMTQAERASDSMGEGAFILARRRELTLPAGGSTFAPMALDVPPGYRALKEADVAAYLADVPAVANNLGGKAADW